MSLSPAQKALYVQANETKDWDLISPVYFVCGFHDDGLWPCLGHIKVEKALLEDNEALIACPSCGMLVTGAWAQENLKRVQAKG